MVVLEASGGVAPFVAYWQGREGGQERANFQKFMIGLCQALELPEPDAAGPDRELNDYVFERAVTFRDADGGTSTGRIDLYKRGCFVLEAKQSRQKGGRKSIPGQADFFVPEAEPRGMRTADRAWDVLMLNARRQAEDYARAIPHEWPPFVLVCDVGHCIEVYADFSGQGKNYMQFPDGQGYRIYLEDLAKPEIRERLLAIWTAPESIDPARRSAKVTREIAERLAAVSRALEAEKHDAQDVALFLMRCLFTMFAEDVGLLPAESFKTLLEEAARDPKQFAPMVEQLWKAMDTGDFAYALRQQVRRFNGKLFKDATALPLRKEQIGELAAAAKFDWRDVEPAIFGTLLEQALDEKERSRIGAHYTPRAYVERLVVVTVIEPLRQEWARVQATAERFKIEAEALDQEAREAGLKNLVFADGSKVSGKKASEAKGKREEAFTAVRAFHAILCATRVLDPACGTGNFLYVALELMKRLEGEVLGSLRELAGPQDDLNWLARQTVDPHQFLGLEVNVRAAEIAELVIWLGYLQWHFRTKGAAPPEPILRDFKNIEHRDAVLTWDGYPVPTVVTADGKRVETFPYARRPEWPEAEYIVGNPPFIGGKDVRANLGGSYAEALWSVHAKRVNESADFVMYWWDRAAELLTSPGSKLRRFGFVTTNSITQTFSRRVVARHLEAKEPVSLLMAIPDHPWTKEAKDHAAVRIAMTVAAAGAHEGVLREVVSETALDTDQPEVELNERIGRINADLTVGADVTRAAPLRANEGLSSPGVKLHGDGFIVTPQEAELLGLGKRPGLERHIRHYRNGRDLMATPRGVMVIDLFGLDAEEVRKRFPEVYQHLMATVKVKRQEQAEKSPTRDAKEYVERWWTHGKPRELLRPALANLPRYIATVETAKHRVFQFLDAVILPDNMLVAIGTDDAFHLGVLSSRIHVAWTLNAGGTLEDRPRYSKSLCFDPFPFPDCPDTLKNQIRAVAEDLDAHRKSRQAEYPGLTLTQMYNVLEKLRAVEKADKDAPSPQPSPRRGEGASPAASGDASPRRGEAATRSGAGEGAPPLTPEEERIKTEGLVLILMELHDRLDALVARAYGWPGTLTDDEILDRLVALNAERTAEEKAGTMKWLRPDYQIPRFGSEAEKARLEEEKRKQREAERLSPRQSVLSLDDDRRAIEGRGAGRPQFPTNDELAETAAVMRELAAASSPVTIEQLARCFSQGKQVEKRVALTMLALARLGHLASADGGESFALRRGG